MNIKRLLDGIEYEWLSEIKIDDIATVTHKHQDINAGDCYICLQTNDKGMQNLQFAIEKGASLIVVDKYVKIPENIAVIKIKDIREGYALIAKNYYGKAADSMRMIGVVGTNGKSTTSYLIWSLLTKNNVMCGLIGTGYYMIGKKRFDLDMTTPDPMDLHFILSVMSNCGVKVVVMEVSSHAIYFKKVCGIKYKIGIYTNLSQDHLDFFGNMENLEKTKHSFFMDGFSQISLINVDDRSGQRLAEKLALPSITVGIEKDCDIKVKSYEISAEGTRFNVSLFRETTIFDSKLIGKYNIYNIVFAIVACKLAGVRIKYLITALKEIEPLSGRANVYTYKDVNYVIDYAHTPDGLKNILTEFRKITFGNLIVVFGAGGDRDKDKRHKMGAVAEKYANKVIITSDNPRNENPLDIMQDIARGVQNKKCVWLIEDRKAATQKAISLAEPFDTIILAGKGSEEYFEKNGKKYFYNDKITLEELLGTKWK